MLSSIASMKISCGWLRSAQNQSSELTQSPLNHEPQPPLQTPSLMPSGSSLSPTQPNLRLQLTLTMSLHFEYPKPLSLRMLTAREWHWEQLLEARKKHDLKNRQRCQAGMLPLARCHPLISDTALDALDQENIAMAMSLQYPLQSQHQSTPSPSPLYPLTPAPWHTFASLVKKPCLWRITLPTPLKSVVKIPLRYHLPTPKTNKLLKGWVYDVAKVKEEGHDNLSLYTMLCCLLTCTMQTKVVKQRADPYCQLCRGMKTTKGQVMSLSLS
jgi:hypothetical protein